MDLALWIAQGLLALAFIAVGLNHAFNYASASQRAGMGWMAAVGRERMRLIGSLEVLGGIGVVLPAVTGILPWLTPLAAAGLALLMLFAIVFHLRRGETSAAVFNAVLGLLAVVVLVGRAVVQPL
jgi:uncharacterized membrane protein YphA (DoxX/SURF4 family)